MRLQLFAALSFCLIAVPTVDSSGATMHQLSQLTISQLCDLLDAKDERVRVQVVACIGIRYENPGAVVHGSQVPANSLPPELPVPRSLLDRLDNMAGSDTNLSVRIAALDALHRIRFRADTSPLIQRHLADKDVSGRLRSARILIQISGDYHEGLATNVIPTLIACLGPESGTEAIWQAAWYLGQLGPKAKEALPALEAVKKHESSKVRKYVREAIALIKRTER